MADFSREKYQAYEAYLKDRRACKNPDGTPSPEISFDALYAFLCGWDAFASAEDERLLEDSARIEGLKHSLRLSEDRFEMMVGQCKAQAKVIDSLRAEKERLREALEKIANCEKRADGDIVDIARTTLVETKKDQLCPHSI